jgi:hypothetical protein
MRKALTQVDPSAAADIDALNGVVLTAIKASLGELCESARCCQATISHAETVIDQLQQGQHHSHGMFLQLAQQFLDTAQMQTSAAQSAVAQAVETTQLIMNLFGVDMKPIKVSRIVTFLHVRHSADINFSLGRYR